MRIAVPLERADLDPEVEISALVTTLRANIEEWWDREAHETTIAARVRRIG